MRIIITIALMLGLTSLAGAEWVNGYLRRDGKYVSGYYRSERNDTVYDNRSYYEKKQYGETNGVGDDYTYRRKKSIPYNYNLDNINQDDSKQKILTWDQD